MTEEELRAFVVKAVEAAVNISTYAAINTDGCFGNYPITELSADIIMVAVQDFNNGKGGSHEAQAD